jgi:UDP-N-acetylmuramoyl-tripeptide--D-alanyl-D-alanine ligase
MKKILQYILKLMAKTVIVKYHPEVIGITGSVGKTSSKEAVYTVLKDKFNVRSSAKNYNNELGVPLTILGINSPGGSLIGWMKVLFHFIKLIVVRDKEYPSVLVLEMGIDRPGDMEYLMSIVKPNVGIETGVGLSHLEFFSRRENIQKEKQILVESVTKDGLAILNFDNDLSREMKSGVKCQVLTYGLSPQADLSAQELAFSFGEETKTLVGTRFKLNYHGSIVPVFMPSVIGYPAVMAALSGAAVGLHYSFNLVDIAQSLENFRLPSGRLNVIEGINNSQIIDDTYNSSPESALMAIQILLEIEKEAGRKIAVLGDMLELGEKTKEGHEEVGMKVAGGESKTGKIDMLIAVGNLGKIIGQIAEKQGMKNVLYFENSNIAGEELKKIIQQNDVILIKGSQGARMDKAVKVIMANPEQASELLVRQGGEWERR